MQNVHVKLLAHADIPAAISLLKYLNPNVGADVLTSRMETIFTDHPHYQLFGAFAGEVLVGVTGAWIATKIWCGRHMEIDNLVVHPDHRSTGAGTALINHLEELAKQKECSMLIIDSYTANHPSHRLYHRLGFEIWSFHFVKPLR
ncbi:GNAT family N-acetyltransferase [Luteolibacter pohnpeiensis]|uniref:GNAT family N-acetyltransferase n=1 Tax=Luteolibacter pohnpeiensis TaxID=454153 RepID=A0A934S0I0_9BACT|nr:GNAT family N-acetyltransferase [Luteolibacter pohnpeiensis]MBK1881005.1 GNAT family N-acetyltransferase [Luteolibacter pohnpeiensis]